MGTRDPWAKARTLETSGPLAKASGNVSKTPVATIQNVDLSNLEPM